MKDRISHLLGSQSAGKGGADMIFCEPSAQSSSAQARGVIPVVVILEPSWQTESRIS